MKSKLHFLKEALHAQKPVAEEEEGELETGDEPDTEAGPLEERKEAKMDGWNEQPIAEDNLGKEGMKKILMAFMSNQHFRQLLKCTISAL